MVLPLIFGSMAKTLIDMQGVPENTNMLQLILGFTAAFFSGILACRWMIVLVKKSQLKYFSYYCLIVSFSTIVYGFF